MRLLFITQKIDEDDDLLAYVISWLQEFARHFTAVEVICLERGGATLPENVHVRSLGKEEGAGRLTYLWRFYQYIFSIRRPYDVVLVHMNPEYVVLGGIPWRLMGKRVGLWYTHRQVNLKLYVAHLFSHAVLTASRYSFRLPSRKLHILGHGIEVGRFACESSAREERAVISVGRITPIKNCDTLIEAAEILKRHWKERFSVTFIGAPVHESDRAYEKKLLRLVEERGLGKTVRFIGSIPNEGLPVWYCRASVSVNMTPPGGLDKAVIESMAAGTPPIVSNVAFSGYFGQYASRLTFPERDPIALAERIRALVESVDRPQIGAYLSRVAGERFSTKAIVKTISTILIEHVRH